MRLIEIPDDGIIRIPINEGRVTVGERYIDLSDFPMINAELVRHGKWMEVYSGDGYDYIGSECDACNAIQEGGSVGMNYCPNCGARMDGTE